MPVKPPPTTKKSEKLVKSLGLTNVSIPRGLVSLTGNFLEALIIEYIHHRIRKNAGKPVWLKLDWFCDFLPYISRSGMHKKLTKLQDSNFIIVKKGTGRHAHKVWFSLHPDTRDICLGKSSEHGDAKVYYNPEVAKENLEASVVYATIISLLKVPKPVDSKPRSANHQLLLDNAKLVEGTGLSIRSIRRGVKWLIDHKKIMAKTTLGNKKLVSFPSDMMVKPVDLDGYFSTDLPSECYDQSQDELPTESYPHDN